MSTFRFVKSRNFEKSFLRLPRSIQLQAKKKYLLFREDIYHPSLKTHKLKGDLVGLYAFSVNYAYRIVFAIKAERIVLLDIGTHTIYK